MTTYYQLLEELRRHLESRLPVPVSLHPGSFGAKDVERLRLHEGDEVLLSMSGISASRAHFELFYKVRWQNGISPQERALGLIQLSDKAMHAWEGGGAEIAGRPQISEWRHLADSQLADMNVYIYRALAALKIIREDYVIEGEDYGN